MRLSHRASLLYLLSVFLGLTLAGDRFGSMILCPPGGQSFATAYMMACEMKKRRRRKRDIGFSGPDEGVLSPMEQYPECCFQPRLSSEPISVPWRNVDWFTLFIPTEFLVVEIILAGGLMRPATLKEMQNICCEFGCEIRDLLAYCDPFSGFNR